MGTDWLIDDQHLPLCRGRFSWFICFLCPPKLHSEVTDY